MNEEALGFTVSIRAIGELGDYGYAVIFARFNGEWILCRHRKRATWEVPGGHIEQGETPLEAARRELYEETGAKVFDIRPMFDYAVIRNDFYSNGQVFMAEVERLGELPHSEIAETRLFGELPPAEELTHSGIQPLLYARLLEIIA